MELAHTPTRKPTPPRLAGWPLIGNLAEFGRARHALLRRGQAQFGPIFSFRLGPKPVAVMLGPEYHQQFFLETDKSLSIEKPYEMLAAMFGKVAFLAPPDVYQEQRPILLEPFKPEKMPKYIEIMQRETQRWLDSLGDSGKLDISAEMGRLVQRVAGYALMGEDFQNKVGQEFWDLYAVLAKSLDFITPPYWPLPKNIRRERAKQRMRELLAPIIAERRRHPEGYDDFLQDFINTPCKSGAPADDETLSALLRGLMFASHETTAGQAAWTLIEILRHPAYQALVQAELDSLLPPGTPIDATVQRTLKHVYWAVREVERLHPSADMLMRLTLEDVEVGPYRVPQGWLVMVSPAVAHRSADLFTQPEEFDPLRFSPERAEDRRHGFAMIGFGGGKHKCTGMNFALNEMMVITSLLFQQFDLTLLTPNPKTNFSGGASRPETTWVRYTRKA